MSPDVVKIWLKREQQRNCVQQALFGFLGLTGGLVVLFLTFWLTYAVVWVCCQGLSAVSELFAGRRLGISHAVRLIASGLFVLLLFIQHFRTRADYWGAYPKFDSPAAAGLRKHAGDLAPLGLALSSPNAIPQMAGASANMIADILLCGPRLITGSWSMWRQAREWKRLDVDSCAQLLVHLHTRTDAVTYAELTDSGWDAWLPQLRMVQGVSFLQKGLVLSGELRKELSQLPGV